MKSFTQLLAIALLLVGNTFVSAQDKDDWNPGDAMQQYGLELKEALEAGEITEAEALALWKEAAEKNEAGEEPGGWNQEDGFSLEGVNCIIMTTRGASEEFVAEFNDGKVFFCCDRCQKAFLESPEDYSEQAERQLIATGQVALRNDEPVMRLEEFGLELKRAIEAGELTEEEAVAKYNEYAAELADKESESDSAMSLEELGEKLKLAVEAGEMSEEEAIEKYMEYAADLEAGKDKLEMQGEGLEEKSEFAARLKALVEEGRLTEAEAIELYESAMGDKDENPENELPENVRATLPSTSTGGESEGPVGTGFFGWAAEATHRFMDNSHTGEPRKIHGMSFRLDYRDHDTTGRTWDNITIRVAHGDWQSIKYNRSREFDLTDEPVVVFDREWSFPTLSGYPALEPAQWGGPQNCLNFRFDEPFEYNGRDAIYVEYVFAGGTTEDGREWEGDLPYGFEYFIDSMPEIGGWRHASGGRRGGVYTGEARVEAVCSYTADGQSVWTSSPKGMPFINWDFEE
ncbi:MAG: hypothetical protein AAF456_25055 [Planctomycetota bacterium]